MSIAYNPGNIEVNRRPGPGQGTKRHGANKYSPKKPCREIVLERDATRRIRIAAVDVARRLSQYRRYSKAQEGTPENLSEPRCSVDTGRMMAVTFAKAVAPSAAISGDAYCLHF